MRVWRETKRNLYLHELLDRKASIRDCSICNNEANWRCLDCFAGPAYCTECCQTSHCKDCFHWIERWTGTFYEQWVLIRLKVLRGCRVARNHLKEGVILLRGSRRLLAQTFAKASHKFKLPQSIEQTSPNDPFDHL